MTMSETMKKRWYISVAILGIVIFSLLWFGFITINGKEGYSTLVLTELNNSVIPQGIIISLTDEDFKEFPQIAMIVRDKNQKTVKISSDGTRFYIIYFTEEERYKFIRRYWGNFKGEPYRFFDYNGKYYQYNFPPMS